MASQKPHILVTRRLPETIEARMATLFETHVNDGDVTLTGDDIIEGLAGKPTCLVMTRPRSKAVNVQAVQKS